MQICKEFFFSIVGGGNVTIHSGILGFMTLIPTENENILVFEKSKSIRKQKLTSNIGFFSRFFFSKESSKVISMAPLILFSILVKILEALDLHIWLKVSIVVFRFYMLFKVNNAASNQVNQVPTKLRPEPHY